MMNTELDTILRTWISPSVPGVAVAIRKGDQIVHCQGYGLANMEWAQPVTPQTVFALGSITKPFTAIETSCHVKLPGPSRDFFQ